MTETPGQEEVWTLRFGAMENVWLFGNRKTMFSGSTPEEVIKKAHKWFEDGKPEAPAVVWPGGTEKPPPAAGIAAVRYQKALRTALVFTNHQDICSGNKGEDCDCFRKELNEALSQTPAEDEAQAKALVRFRQAVLLQNKAGHGNVAQIAAINEVEAADQACKDLGL